MENKKTIIAIVIVTLLIIILAVTYYLYNIYSNRQINLLTEEANKILQMDIVKDEIDTEIKTDGNFAIVEKATKEYIEKLKNIHDKIDEINSGINPNDIFKASNVEDKNLEEIDNIIKEYKEKCDNYFKEYKELAKEENIMENIENKNIKIRKNYYINLYKSIIAGEVMKKQLNTLQEAVEKEKDKLYSKLNVIERIKSYLEKNENYWNIKDDKIQFTNINKITEYYNLLNELAN